MKSLKIAAVVITLVVSTGANAALLGRLAATEGGTDYQAYYDDVADLTWLADANYAQTSNYAGASPVGRMSWQAANEWVANLTVGDVGGWRLADTLQPDASCSIQRSGISNGRNCTGSEMGNLFYNTLGNSQGSSGNTGPFSNIQSKFYWSATALDANTDINAWAFNMGTGIQGYSKMDKSFYAWAVQSGDISAVPVPAAVWLFGSGLIGLAGIARRKKV